MRGEFELSGFRKGLREADAAQRARRAFLRPLETAAILSRRPLTATELEAERRASFPGNSEPAAKAGSK